VSISDFDLPGPTRNKVTCSRCGQVVRDHKEVTKDGLVFCVPCAGGAYFSNSREVNWPDMNRTPDDPSPNGLSDRNSRVHEAGKDA
jgi:formylmethanofuran dehydrogenase subunit E